MMRWLGFIAWLLATPALADDTASAARAAAAQLDKASRALQQAGNAQNRVQALTETIRAFENGLQAMRVGQRRAAVRERALTQELKTREAEVSRLLGVLQTIGKTPAPVLLLHPSGPVGTARSGMILADITPALQRRASALRAKLEEVQVLRDLQKTARQKMQTGLEDVQEARATLSQAMADRTDLPRRFTEDPVKTALLIASAETLEGFASGLDEIAVEATPADLPGVSGRKGALPMPVRGRILRHAHEADAAGITRPGMLVATRPQALVTSPAAATLRYQGPLLDYGNVIILEPESGILMVFAGLDEVYGEIGEVLPAGAPVGIMPGAQAEAGMIADSAAAGATEQRETLYIEVRQDNVPQDPENWFEIEKEG